LNLDFRLCFPDAIDIVYVPLQCTESRKCCFHLRKFARFPCYC